MKRTLILTFASLLLVTGLFAQHDNTVSWTWTKGAPPNDGAATGFNVKRGPTGGPYATIQAIPSPTTLQYADSAVVEGQTVCYVISATGNGGTESANSSETCGTTPFSTANIPSKPSVVSK